MSKGPVRDATAKLGPAAPIEDLPPAKAPEFTFEQKLAALGKLATSQLPDEPRTASRDEWTPPVPFENASDSVTLGRKAWKR